MFARARSCLSPSSFYQHFCPSRLWHHVFSPSSNSKNCNFSVSVYDIPLPSNGEGRCPLFMDWKSKLIYIYHGIYIHSRFVFQKEMSPTFANCLSSCFSHKSVAMKLAGFSLTSKWVAYSSFPLQDCSSFILAIPSCIWSIITIFVSQLSVQRDEKNGERKKVMVESVQLSYSCSPWNKKTFDSQERRNVPLCTIRLDQIRLPRIGGSLWRILSGDSVILCA